MSEQKLAEWLNVEGSSWPYVQQVPICIKWQDCSQKMRGL